MARGKRPLSSEERALWKHVTRHVRPLNPVGPADEDTEAPDPGSVASVLTLAPPDDAKSAKAEPKRATNSPRKTETRKAPTRRDLPAQARLDLHGMTQDEAHRALVQFIMMSVALGMRRVLVITGKGKALEPRLGVAKAHPNEGRGILRRLVPLWLEVESLRPFIAGVASAPITLGGPGALVLDLNLRAGNDR